MSTEATITAERAAKQLSVSPRYVRKLCSSGKITATKHGASWLIPVSELSKINQGGPKAVAAKAAAEAAAKVDKSEGALQAVKDGMGEDEEVADGSEDAGEK